MKKRKPFWKSFLVWLATLTLLAGLMPAVVPAADYPELKIGEPFTVSNNGEEQIFSVNVQEEGDYSLTFTPNEEDVEPIWKIISTRDVEFLGLLKDSNVVDEAKTYTFGLDEYDKTIEFKPVFNCTTATVFIQQVQKTDVKYVANHDKAGFFGGEATKSKEKTIQEVIGWKLDPKENIGVDIDSRTTVFLGWSVNENATEPDEEITVTPGLTLYAVWKECAPVNVTFHLNWDTARGEAYIRDDEDQKVETLTMVYPQGEIMAFLPMAETEAESWSSFGWTAREDGQEDGGEHIAGEVRDLYAVWHQAANMKFKANREDSKEAWFSVNLEVDEDEDGKEIDNLVFTTEADNYAILGSVFDPMEEAPEFKKIPSGKVLAGWSMDPNAETPDEPFEIQSTKPFTMYAVWADQTPTPTPDPTPAPTPDPAAKKDISNAEVTLANTSYTYTGKEIKPAVTVKDGSGELKENVHYTVSYLNSGC